MSFKPFENNPRQISDAKLNALGASMSELGSLDGFIVAVQNVEDTDKTVVCGNQKHKHIDLNACDIVWTHINEPIHEDGTWKVGNAITDTGAYYPIQLKVWDLDTQWLANVRANNMGGRNDVSILRMENDELLTSAGINLALEEGKNNLEDNLTGGLSMLPNVLEGSGVDLSGSTVVGEDVEGEIESTEESNEPRTSDMNFVEGLNIEEKETIHVKLGDVYSLHGKKLEHRIMCGDSTSKDDLDVLLNDAFIDLVFTDPPYGISIVTDKTVGGGGITKFGTIGEGKIVKTTEYKEIANDNTTKTAKKFYNQCLGLGLDNYIIWGGNYFTDFLPPSRGWVVWDKENGATDFADIEMAWTSYDKSSRLYKHLWHGMCRKGGHHLEGKKRIHPTQKPVGLFMEIFTKYDFSSVLDGFLGSGSTLAAAHQSGKVCYGMELDPYYIQLILQRMLKIDDSIIVINENTGEEVTHLFE